MRIHFLLSQDLDSPSGVGRYLPLARALVSQDIKVTISGLHPDFDHLQSRTFSMEEVDVRYVGPMHILRVANEKRYYSGIGLMRVVISATIGLILSVLNNPADIIIVGKPHPMNSIAGLLGKILHKSILIVDIDDYEAASNLFSSRIQRSIISFFENSMPRLANHVTTNTYFTRERLIRRGIDAQKIIYLSNGIDPARFDSVDQGQVRNLRERLGIEGKKVVAFIGSISKPNHPVDLLLDAFQILSKSMDNLVLLLVGSGNSYQELTDKAKEIGILERTIFVGRVPYQDIPLYYRLADVSIDPVLDNDAARGRQPLKLFESWAAGVSFVTGDVGDRRLLAGDPPAIYLCKPADPDALADAIGCVLSNRSISDQLHTQGTARVQQYTWRLIGENLRNLLNNNL
jgi:glycosyltransferase involved in cell wall biosynthesis